MTLGGLRVSLRLGMRSVRRSRWRSALVALLIALPVAAMAGSTAILDTITPTPERIATETMGRADLLVQPLGEDATVDRLRALLPDGSIVEPLTITDDATIIGGAELPLRVHHVDLRGLGAGLLTIVDGRPPIGDSEIAVSPSLARMAEIGVGRTLILETAGAKEVVGLVENPANLRDLLVLAAPGPGEPVANYLVGLPTGVTAEEGTRGFEDDDSTDRPFFAFSRAMAAYPLENRATAVFVLGGLALIEAALIASAAFAVSLRRRQRELGLLGAAGGEPRHLAASVLTEGLLLGLIGSVVGVICGLALAAGVGPWLDQLTGRRNPPVVLTVQWPLIAAGIGIVAALVAAALPARTASRVTIHEALSGRRPLPVPARRALWLGIAMVVGAFALTLLGASFRENDTEGTVSLLMLLCGAVLGVLGFGACSPWILERLERPAARLPLAPRLALRDTARFRSRNGPILTAVLASFAATVALATILTSQEAQILARYPTMLRQDQLLIVGANSDLAGPEAAGELDAIAAVALTQATGPPGTFIFIEVSNPEAGGFGGVAVGDEQLLTALGGESAIDAFNAGAVVLFAADGLDPGRARLHVEDETSGSGRGDGQPIDSIAVPTDVPYGSVPTAVLSTAAARTLGLEAAPEGRFLIRLDHDVTDADLALAGSKAAAYADTFVQIERVTQRPGEEFRLLLVLASLAMALSVTGVAVALGEAESRRDQQMLLALGAEPAVRRRITAARAGVLAGLAGILAVPAGLLPVWGLLLIRGAALVLPLPEVIASLAALPIAAVVGAAILSRPIGQWTELRA